MQSVGNGKFNRTAGASGNKSFCAVGTSTAAAVSTRTKSYTSTSTSSNFGAVGAAVGVDSTGTITSPITLAASDASTTRTTTTVDEEGNEVCQKTRGLPPRRVRRRVLLQQAHEPLHVLQPRPLDELRRELQ